jgi:hypothetical protein
MISNAQGNYLAGSNGVQTNEWGVYLTFNAEGTTAFSKVTKRLTVLTGVRNQFAIVLDGRVISAPRTLAAIADGKPVISGSFTELSSKALADQLKFGALPIGFEVQSTSFSSDRLVPLVRLCWSLPRSMLVNSILSSIAGVFLCEHSLKKGWPRRWIIARIHSRMFKPLGSSMPQGTMD